MARPFGAGDASKSWFGLFNLLLEANHIVIVENLHALAFSDTATSRELLRRQLQLITSSRSAILSSDKELGILRFESAGLAGARRMDPSAILSSNKELDNLRFESAGLAGARRMDPLKVIKSPASLTNQERSREYRRKRSAHRGSTVPLR